MSIRRMLPFILINIVVSAVVVLAILYWWDSRGVEAEPGPLAQATIDLPTPPPVAPAGGVELPPPTDTPEPVDSPPIHFVQSGETLMSISQFYDVPMDDIIAANDISNPNVLSVGQQLLIPVGGLPTATPPPPTPTTDAPPTPNPTLPPAEEGQADVQITGVVGAGDLTGEAVQIQNLGSRQVGLLGWQLVDEDDHAYTFRRFTLYGAGSGVLVYTEAGQDSPTDLYWGLEEPIWRSGERVTLLDAEGSIQATFDIP